MAVFTQGGRIALAQAVLNMSLFLGVGEGNLAWDDIPRPTTPEEQAAQDAAWSVLADLEAKVGLTRTRDKYFVEPNPDGDIVMADGAKYSMAVEPTAFVYIRFQLDLNDAVGTTLRETGVFLDPQIDPSVPAGQMFIPSGDVLAFGRMLQVDRFAPIVRDGSIGQTFTYILTM